MISNIEGLLDRICGELRVFTDYAVIGLSGGADSTLVACLCVRALGAKNVLGVHMPYGDLDAKTFNTRSYQLAYKLDISSQFVPIGVVSDEISRAVEKSAGMDMSALNKGNARARARMCILYAIAGSIGESLSEFKIRVIGTGNLSESYIGYGTKGGDDMADIHPIGNLFKSEVYQLLDYFRDKGILTEDLIDRTPSAGLWEGQTDEGELGYTYNQMEHAIRLREGMTALEAEVPVEVSSFVIRRHENNKHKHEAIPVIGVREYCK